MKHTNTTASVFGCDPCRLGIQEYSLQLPLFSVTAHNIRTMAAYLFCSLLKNDELLKKAANQLTVFLLPKGSNVVELVLLASGAQRLQLSRERVLCEGGKQLTSHQRGCEGEESFSANLRSPCWYVYRFQGSRTLKISGSHMMLPECTDRIQNVCRAHS